MKTYFFSGSNLLACDKSAMRWNVKCIFCCVAFVLKRGTAYCDPIPTLSQGYFWLFWRVQEAHFAPEVGSSWDAPHESLEDRVVQSTQPA